MQRNIVYLFIISFLAFSCQGNNSNNQRSDASCIQIDLTNAVEDGNVTDLGKSEITDIAFADQIEEVKIVPLETNDNSLIYSISDVFFTDNRIIIDNRADGSAPIKVFDNNGKYIASIKGGNGPTEVSYLFCMTIDYKNKQILITHPNGIMYTNLNAEFIKNDRIDWYFLEMAVLDDKILFKTTEHQNPNGYYSDYTIFVKDRDYNDLYAALPPRYNKSLMSINTSVARVQEGIAFTKMGIDTVYCYNGEKVYPIYNLVYSNSIFGGKQPDVEDGMDFIDRLTAENGYTYFGFFFEASNTQYFQLTNLYHREALHVYRNKQTGNIVWNKETKENGYNTLNTFATVPINTYGDYFISSLGYEYKQQHLKCLHPFLSPEDLKKVENMTEDDNPMLILYKFKKF